MSLRTDGALPVVQKSRPAAAGRSSQRGDQRRGRVMLVVLLAVGVLTAVGTLAAAYVNQSNSTPNVAASSTPSPAVSASPSATATALTSEEARAEYYRRHPRATGWWQWVLIGGVLGLLGLVAVLLITRPGPSQASRRDE